MATDDPAIVVAVIAAAASVGAAVVASVASAHASRSARAVVSVNHRVAMLDAQVEQLREDYRNFLTSVGSVDGTATIGAMLAACEVLCANPRAGERLVRAADAIRGAVTSGVAVASSPMPPKWGAANRAFGLPDAEFETMRAEFATALRTITAEREEVLLDRRPWWALWRR